MCVKTSIQPLLLCKLTTTEQRKATPGFDYAHLHMEEMVVLFQYKDFKSPTEVSIKKKKVKNHMFQMCSMKFSTTCSFLLQVIIGDRAEYKTHVITSMLSFASTLRLK